MNVTYLIGLSRAIRAAIATGSKAEKNGSQMKSWKALVHMVRRGRPDGAASPYPYNPMRMPGPLATNG